MKLTESQLRNIIKQELKKVVENTSLNEGFAQGMGELYKDFILDGIPATPEAIETSMKSEEGILEITATLAQLATMKQDYGKIHGKLKPLASYIVKNADRIKQAISTLKDPFETMTKKEAMKHLQVLASN